MILRAMIWLSAPLVVFCFFSRGYLARLIFSRGNNEIGLIFGYLTLAIFFRIIYSIISRWFYAQKDTRTPLLVSVFTIGLNIFLAYTLSKGYGVAGLALAQSIVAAIEVFILSVIMLIRDYRLFNLQFWGGVTRIISISGFSLVATFIIITIYPLSARDTGILTLGSKLILIGAVTFGTHLSLSVLFGLEEARPVIRRMKRVATIILKPVKIDF
jgi:putative peptidoglycan lipid II flippase